MAVSRAVALAQIMRFRSYPNFPAGDKPQQEELARAFEQACSDDDEAQAAGDYLVRTLHFAPLPADVWKAAEAVRETLSSAALPEWRGFGYRCKECRDMRFIVTERGAERCPACSKAPAK